MRRNLPIRSLVLFTTLRLDTFLPGTFISTIRSLSHCPCPQNNATLRIPPLSSVQRAKMSSLSPASANAKDEVDRLAEPAEKEAEMLGKNDVREEALKEIKKEEKKEEALPKLSAADFKVYNSMAEHMEYFVCPFSFFLPTPSCYPSLTLPLSMTTSANLGPSSTPLPPPAPAPATFPSANFSKPVYPSSPTSTPTIPSKNNTSSPFSPPKCQNSRVVKTQQSC